MRSPSSLRVENFGPEVRRQIYSLRGRALCDLQSNGRHPSPMDEFDQPELHPETLLAATFEGDKVIATGRISQEIPSNPNELQLSFMATDERYRNKGRGTATLRALELMAQHQFGDKAFIRLHARLPADSLYRRAGYVAMSEPYQAVPEDKPDALHIDMYKELGYTPNPEIWAKIMATTEALMNQGGVDEDGTVHFDWSAAGSYGYRFVLETATQKPGEEPSPAPHALRFTTIAARTPQTGRYVYGPNGIVEAVGPATNFISYMNSTETKMQTHERMLAEFLGTYGHVETSYLCPGDRGYGS